ncbi:MAG: D-alanine--D-alanine ligase [Actinobacteria bacterium 69-20]|jgi:D-alanine-D-alanine ligase|nr:D-alanine--D-alanine ligase [Actinomycetota bacterium]OJV24847.1 MAG: D-alanine--D-alanine ligase [Actinobacteria bacterium 69-20]
MTTQHIMVLAGGLSHEREVSLRSGSRLAQALRATGFDVTVRDADSQLLDWVAAHRPDAAVIALHGGRGENGSVQAVLEMTGVPFVGTESRQCRLAWDKPTAKVLLRRASHLTPDWVTLSHNAFRDFGAAGLISALGSRFAFPLVVKPYQGGSALGTVIVHEAGEMPGALVGSLAYGDVLLVERYVAGTEVAVSVIESDDGPIALPPVEIVPSGEFFDYEARYTAGMTTYHTPARLEPELMRAAADLALAAHSELGLRDVSRTDMIVTPSGEVHFLEVNVSPGLTETSMLPMSVTAADRTLGEIYDGLIGRAIGRGR